MNDRRRLLMLLGPGARCIAFPSLAQRPLRQPRVALSVFGRAQGPTHAPLESFRQGMGEFGYTEGRNITFADPVAAGFVDKIIRGARADGLPIEQSTRIERVTNLETAQALGVTIPQTLLRADEIIQSRASACRPGAAPPG